MKRVVLLVPLLLTACYGAATETGQTDTGVILPLTGSASTVGQSFKKGFTMTAENVSYRIHDSQSTPRHGLSAARQAVTAGDADVLVTLLSSVATPMRDIAARHQAPLIASSVSADKFTHNRPYVFRLFPPARQEATKAAKFANERWDSIAIIHVTTPFGTSMHNHFSRNFDGRMETHSFDVDEQSLRTQLLKARDAQAIYFVGYPAHQVTVIQERARLDLNMTILAPIAMSSRFVRETVKEEFDNIYMTTTEAFTDTQRNNEFRARFTQQYGHEPDWPATFGHDMATLLSALPHEPTPKQVKNVNITGLNGQLSFDEHGDVQLNLVIAEARNGSVRIVSE